MSRLARSAAAPLRRRLSASTALSAALAVGLVLAAAPAPVLANPQGGRVVAGDASITQRGGTTTVRQDSRRGIITWDTFSIGKGETTRFIQPSSDAVTLNRVTGEDVSRILGTLQANGRIYLVNPNGIIIDKSGKIDAAGLVASAHDIANSDFLRDRLAFTKAGEATASVINRGSITVAEGGLAALVGPSVRNDGAISARLGTVALAAGQGGVTIDLYGDDLIVFEPAPEVVRGLKDALGNRVVDLLANTGRIEADGGRVVLSARQAKAVVDSAINLSGIVSASSVRQEDGRIVLDGGPDGVVAVSGSLRAEGDDTGEHGGRIAVLGERVGILSGGAVSAVGDAGGGTVLIGGDRQGQGDTRTAERTYVSPQAAISASATGKGDGGKAVVWADDATGFFGTIRADAGPQGGDGGFIEVSGKVSLAFDGTASVKGRNGGKGGEFLLDPKQLFIVDTGSDSGVTATPYTETWFVQGGGSDSYLTTASIETMLRTGDVGIYGSYDPYLDPAELGVYVRGTITAPANGYDLIIGSYGPLQVSGTIDFRRSTGTVSLKGFQADGGTTATTPLVITSTGKIYGSTNPTTSHSHLDAPIAVELNAKDVQILGLVSAPESGVSITYSSYGDLRLGRTGNTLDGTMELSTAEMNRIDARHVVLDFPFSTLKAQDDAFTITAGRAVHIAVQEAFINSAVTIATNNTARGTAVDSEFWVMGDDVAGETPPMVIGSRGVLRFAPATAVWSTKGTPKPENLNLYIADLELSGALTSDAGITVGPFYTTQTSCTYCNSGSGDIILGRDGNRVDDTLELGRDEIAAMDGVDYLTLQGFGALTTAGSSLFGNGVSTTLNSPRITISHNLWFQPDNPYVSTINSDAFSTLTATGSENANGAPLVITKGTSVAYRPVNAYVDAGLSLVADDIALAGTISAPNGTVALMPYTLASTPVRVGARSESTRALDLSADELASIDAAILNVGGFPSGTDAAASSLEVLGSTALTARQEAALVAGQVVVNAPLSFTVAGRTGQADAAIYAMADDKGAAEPFTLGKDGSLTVTGDSNAATLLIVRADDQALNGTITSHAGNGGVALVPFDTDAATIGYYLGGASGNARAATLELSSAELGRINAAALSLGDLERGSWVLRTDGALTLPDIDHIALQGGRIFINHAVTGTSDAGPDSGGVDLTADDSADYHGDTTVTLGRNGAIALQGQALTITADDVDLLGSASIDTGGGTITLMPYHDTVDLRLGGPSSSLTLSNSEINAIKARTFVFGNPSVPASFSTGGAVRFPAGMSVLLYTGSASLGHDISVPGGTLVLVAETGSIARTGGTLSAETITLSAAGAITADVDATVLVLDGAKAAITGSADSVSAPTAGNFTLNGVQTEDIGVDEPVEPEEPTEPEVPTEPTGPTEPTDPTEPPGPIIPTTAVDQATANTASLESSNGLPTHTGSSAAADVIDTLHVTLGGSGRNGALTETLQAAAEGKGNFVEALRDLNLRDVAVGDQLEAFRSLTITQIVTGLRASGNTQASVVADYVEQTMQTGDYNLADLRTVLRGQNVDPAMTMSYLALLERARKQQRGDLFSLALDILRADPRAADVFTTLLAEQAVSPGGGAGAVPAFAALPDTLSTPNGIATVSARIANPGIGAEVRVNGRWVFVGNDGTFTARVPVQAGQTVLTVAARGADGTTSEKAITVTAAKAADPAAPVAEGKKVALLIGAADYQDPHVPDLDTPMADVTALAKLLGEVFGYEVRLVANPTKAQIVEAMTSLAQDLGESDQAVVYYAGHGYSFPDSKEGYWLPADAATNSVDNWVSTSDLSHFLHRIPARNVQVVADSCYSGAFAKELTVSAEQLAQGRSELLSRRAVMVLTSGGDEPVWDGGANGHSLFAATLMDHLRAIPAEERGIDIFSHVRDVVSKEAPQTPQYGAVISAGYDLGGDYLFAKPQAGSGKPTSSLWDRTGIRLTEAWKRLTGQVAGGPLPPLVRRADLADVIDARQTD